MSDLISRQAAEALFRNAREELMKQDRKEHIKDFIARDLMLLNAEQLIHLLPSVEPEQEKRTEERTETHACDCISRQAARSALLDKGQHSKRYKLGETWELNLMEIEEALGELPSVEPERKPGKCVWCSSPYRIEYYWIDREGNTASYQDEDRHIVATGIAKFCPNCGAKKEVDG